jgi:hypothetical protein
MSDQPDTTPPAVPVPIATPKLPEVDSPSQEDVLDGVPSAEQVIKDAQAADEVVKDQPSVDEILGRG